MNKKKKILVTAGSTNIPIDKVRVITNIFKGKTGRVIAEYFDKQGHQVTLLTSNFQDRMEAKVNQKYLYGEYDELYREMEGLITTNKYDVIIHSAAVSDYKVDGTFTPAGMGRLMRIDNDSKINSNHPELYLKLVPTRKIIDDIRTLWGFKGKLVKFKLQVDMSDDELLEIAKKSRETSGANVIVANCLEWSKDRAYVITENSVDNIDRESLPKVLEALL